MWKPAGPALCEPPGSVPLQTPGRAVFRRSPGQPLLSRDIKSVFMAFSWHEKAINTLYS